MEHAAPLTVSAAEMVAGHVTLDISCIDRLYLNGYVASLQTAGEVIYFFHDHRQNPIASPALFEPIGAKFRKDMKDWAQAKGAPVIPFKAGDRKADVMAPYLEAAAASGRSQVAAIGCAQEFQAVWTARKRDTDPGKPPRAPSGPPPGGFKTKIDQYCGLVTMNVFYKHSRLKQYLKDGTALRIETVIKTTPATFASTAGWRISPSCRRRCVQSTPSCWKLRLPARTRHL